MTHDEIPTDGPTDHSPQSHVDGDVSALEATLTARAEPYARATVVRREPPVSANVGDRAVVTANGELHGWIGGTACAQSTVRTQAVDVIETNSPRLIGIAPDPETISRPGLDAFPMTCHSDGVLEVFIEPVTPRTELVIVGDSPVARSLARLASELTVDVTLVAPNDDAAEAVPDGTSRLATVEHEEIVDAIGAEPLVVVASMGEYDAHGIAAGVLSEAPYVGLVASDARAAEEVDRAAALLDRSTEAVEAAVTNPAGVDIDAYGPAEIAASILAEIVDVRSRQSATASRSTTDETATDRGADEADGGPTVVDPVCGMTVDPATASTSVEHGGDTYYFCCRRCAESFEADPEEYLADSTEVDA